MPSLSPRHAGRRRRAIAEINMVPFIDVMLVLLIIFMVSAPLITTGVVDLPSVGKAAQRPAKVIELEIGADERIRLRIDQQESGQVTMGEVAARVRDAQGGRSDVPVVISADKQIRYDTVVRVMDTLQRAGIQRVGLAVRQGG
ncbi:MAG: protein TolR [Rubrivivax sp.]|jgi:biopolymer transport protein TolR|nr:protein TolR [Rubrivivax sp.]